MRIPRNCAALISVASLALGCSSGDAPVAQQGSDHAEHSSAGANPHAGHNMATMRSMLMVETNPAKLAPGDDVALRLMIHATDGKVVREFEPIHEKLVHLIIVREGLDQFAHLHPKMNDDGSMSVEYTFPAAGVYHLFADHKPAGGSQALAVAKLEVAGAASAAEPLAPNVPGKINADGLHAEIAIANAKAGTETGIAFLLRDDQDMPVTDLLPYLGAMGHLVIISADAREYVHAHPAEGLSNVAPGGRVKFEAHFAKAGIYKAWGQFRRTGKVLTVPFVIKVE